ncbi:MAG: hypothetical protein K6F93_05785 [Lachnospiraceae bacterium]|nr:hypothetical protein [Lachnospiraceae bacterium]
MKRITKVLAIVLALVLAFGSIPASAASGDLSLTKTKKTIFADGCKGTTVAGKVAKYYSYANIKKIVKNFDSSTMDIKLESSDSSIATTDDKKDRVNAVAPGKAAITVNVFDKKTSDLLFSKSIVVTVKKNATKDSLIVSGIKDGDKFKVKDSVTVKLTRKSGVDTDLRRLVSSGDGVSIEEAGTRKYKVTFTKAGTFTLTAESYQSSKYDGATAAKSFSVTVTEAAKEEEKKEEEKKEEEKKQTKLTAKQTASEVFELSGSAITDKYTKDSVKLYKMYGSTRVDINSAVSKVTVSENTATITMMTELEQATTFYVEYGDEVAEFTTTSVDKDDPVKSIKHMEMLTRTATVNESVDIEFRYRDEKGIDITKLVETYANPRVVVEEVGNSGYGYVSGRTVYVYEKGRTLNVKASLTTDFNLVTSTPITITATGTIIGIEKQLPRINNTTYTFSNDGDATYLKKGDKENKTICVNDANYSLEVLFGYSDGKYKTLAEAGVTSVVSVNEAVLMIGGASPSGGVYVYPNTVGQSYIKFYVGDQELTGFGVAVSQERKASTIEVTLDKNLLNVDPLTNDNIEISAVVKDQYQCEIKNAPLSVTQTEASLRDTVVSFGAFINGKLVVNGTDVSIIGAQPQYAVQAVVSCGDNLKRTVIFSVRSSPYDPTKLATYASKIMVDGSLNIDTGLTVGKQEDEETSVYVTVLDSNGFYLLETAGTILDKAPLGTLKAADFGKAAGTAIIATTIQYRPDGGAQYFITSGPNIDTSDPFCITFDPVSAGTKLGKGTYTIVAYVITLGETSSNIRTIGQKTVVVRDNQETGTFTRKSEKAYDGLTIEQKVAECFDFYFDGQKIDPSNIKSVDYTVSNTNTTIVRSVTFSLTNDPYGPFDLTIKIVDSQGNNMGVIQPK